MSGEWIWDAQIGQWQWTIAESGSNITNKSWKKRNRKNKNANSQFLTNIPAVWAGYPKDCSGSDRNLLQRGGSSLYHEPYTSSAENISWQSYELVGGDQYSHHNNLPTGGSSPYHAPCATSTENISSQSYQPTGRGQYHTPSAVYSPSWNYLSSEIETDVDLEERLPSNHGSKYTGVAQNPGSSNQYLSYGSPSGSKSGNPDPGWSPDNGLESEESMSSDHEPASTIGRQNYYRPTQGSMRDTSIVKGLVQQLDSSYRVRKTDYKRFFIVGKVFSTLWSESFTGDLNDQNQPFVSDVIYNSKVFTKIRRFVVVRTGNRCCTCLPITSYEGKGHKKGGITLEEHGFVYSNNNPPRAISGIYKHSLKVNLRKGVPHLRNQSLINYERLHTIECNVKVKEIGDLDTASRAILLQYFRESVSETDEPGNNIREVVPEPEIADGYATGATGYSSNFYPRAVHSGHLHLHSQYSSTPRGDRGHIQSNTVDESSQKFSTNSEYGQCNQDSSNSSTCLKKPEAKIQARKKIHRPSYQEKRLGVSRSKHRENESSKGTETAIQKPQPLSGKSSTAPADSQPKMFLKTPSMSKPMGHQPSSPSSLQSTSHCEFEKAIQRIWPENYSQSSRLDICHVLEAGLISFCISHLPAGRKLGDFLTITGDVFDAQASYCRDYLMSTWPDVGEILLESLEAFTISPQPKNVCRQDQTVKIQVQNDAESGLESPTSLFVSVQAVYLIHVQILSALSWLSAAVRHSPNTEISTSYTMVEVDEKLQRTFLRSSELKAVSHLEACWHGMFPHCVIARGFPISQRREGKGLEISFQNMLELSYCLSIIDHKGALIPHGLTSVLIPVSELAKDNALQWHFEDKKERGLARISTISQILKKTNIQPLRKDFRMQELEQKRCFLGWVEKANVLMGTKGYNEEFTWSEAKQLDQVLKSYNVTFGLGSVGGQNSATLSTVASAASKHNRGIFDVVASSKHEHVIFYDTTDKTGWCIPKASAILHIAQVIISSQGYQTFKGEANNRENVQLHFASPGSDGYLEALEALKQNLGLKIGKEKETARIEEPFEDLIQNIWHSLDNIAAGLAAAETGDAAPKYIHGVEFQDVVRLSTQVKIKKAQVNQPWTHITKEVPVVLFCGKMGQPISPVSNNLCSSWKRVPVKKNYLVMMGSTVSSFLEGGLSGLAPLIEWELPNSKSALITTHGRHESGSVVHVQRLRLTKRKSVSQESLGEWLKSYQSSCFVFGDLSEKPCTEQIPDQLLESLEVMNQKSAEEKNDNSEEEPPIKFAAEDDSEPESEIIEGSIISERSVGSVVSQESIFSNEARSTTSDSSLGSIVNNAVDHLAAVFMRDPELSILYHEAQTKLDQNKLIRNHNRLLKNYFIDLRGTSQSYQHLQIVRYLRGAKQRNDLTEEVFQFKKPHVEALPAAEINKMRILDHYLETAIPTPLPHISAEAVMEQVQDLSEGSGIEDLSGEETSDDEAEPLTFEHVDRATEFLMKGHAFQNYKSAFRYFVHPPTTLREALDWGGLQHVRRLLKRNFDSIASGEYIWLKELADSGYTWRELAAILWETVNDAPWIFVEELQPVTRVGQEPSNIYHIPGCVHRQDRNLIPRPTIPSDTMIADDLSVAEWNLTEEIDRNLVATLCGLAGIIPKDRDKANWNGMVVFSEYNSASSVTYRISTSQETPRARLRGFVAHISEALEGLCTASCRLQGTEFCCNSFTILRKVEIDNGEVIELCRVQFGVVSEFLSELYAVRDSPGPSTIRKCKAKAIDILGILGDAAEHFGDAYSEDDVQDLHICAVAVQFLSLGLLSYCQAHTGAIRPYFLDTPQVLVHLHGLQELAALTGSWCQVTAQLEELTCVGDMIQDSVLVFQLLKASDQTLPGSKKFDLLTTPEDLIDTWGPGQFFVDSETASQENIYAMSLGGGIIQAIADDHGKFHWMDTSRLDASAPKFKPCDKILVGSAVRVNPNCVGDEFKRWLDSEGFLDPLGTSDPAWEPKERQVGFVLGQYLNVQYNRTLAKFPGVTLKTKMLNLPDQELLHILKSPWGLQVSFCTGVARRVLLREMIADLLPPFAERRFPIPKLWGRLKTDHKIIESFQRKDDSTWTLQKWMGDLSLELQDLVFQLLRSILSEMQHTGIDRKGDSFRVAWIKSDRPILCFKIPCKEESYWARMLADSSVCATFAYITSKCLESDRHKCRGPTAIWCQATALLETAVCCHPPITEQPQSWVLRDSESYSIGLAESLVVKVIRPSTSDRPMLYVSWSRSQVPDAVRYRLKRVPKRIPHLRETQFEGSHAEPVLILAAKATS